MYDEMMKYVQALFKDHGDEASKISSVPFRKRSEHSRRVYLWAKRLLDGIQEIDIDAVLIASIFHDTGYSINTNDLEHADGSGLICERYLNEKGFDKNKVDFIAYLVRNHSNRYLMNGSDTPLELVILMEADILDETGAMSIVWDCLHEGSQTEQSYEKVFSRLNSRSMLSQNPMITEKARTFWAKKQSLMHEFNQQLAFDLGL